MLILGLDPGSRHTGYGLVEWRQGEFCSVEYGRFSSAGKTPLPERLAGQCRSLDQLLDRRAVDVAVLETPFHGLNSRSLIVLAQARGALLAHLAGRGIEIHEYSPAEIKSAVTGQGRADKGQIARMVRLHLSLRETPDSSDASDALAVAICYAHRRRMERLTELGGASG